MSGRRLKAASLLVGVALAALALVSWTQTWFVVVLAGESAGHPPISAGGDTSAPAVSALAIACLAAFGAMAISGRFFRVVLAVLQIVIGACIVLSATLALSAPAFAVAPLVTQATSVEGTSSLVRLIDSIGTTAWPWGALVAGVLLAALGVVILMTARRWPESGRKYQAVRFEGANGGDSPESDWDSLSDGSDPTSR